MVHCGQLDVFVVYCCWQADINTEVTDEMHSFYGVSNL